MGTKRGLDAVRASLDSIFSPEGLKNIQLLREGALTTLPGESFQEKAGEAPSEGSIEATPEETTEVTSKDAVHADLSTKNETLEATSVAHIEEPSEETTEQPSEAATEVKIPPAGGRGGLTANQTRVLDFLLARAPCRLAYQDIAAALGMSRFSVRDIIHLFRDKGWLELAKWRTGVQSGVTIALRRECLPEAVADASGATSIVPSEVRNTPTQALPAPAISAETLGIAWPTLAEAGFGTEHLARIGRSLAELGKPSGHLVQGLDHLEYALAHGLLADAGDPVAFAVRTLAQNGYYPRPEGYVSPEEQALRDREEEKRALDTARDGRSSRETPGGNHTE